MRMWLWKKKMAKTGTLEYLNFWGATEEKEKGQNWLWSSLEGSEDRQEDVVSLKLKGKEYWEGWHERSV